MEHIHHIPSLFVCWLVYRPSSPNMNLLVGDEGNYDVASPQRRSSTNRWNDFIDSLRNDQERHSDGIDCVYINLPGPRFNMPVSTSTCSSLAKAKRRAPSTPYCIRVQINMLKGSIALFGFAPLLALAQ